MLLLLLSPFSPVWLYDPIDGSPPGSPIPGIFQSRILEWVAISCSSSWKWKVKWKMKVKLLSRVRLLATPWTVAYQAPLFMGFPFQARIPEWIAISFSRRSSCPKDWTRVSRIVGRRFTVWTTREVQVITFYEGKKTGLREGVEGVQFQWGGKTFQPRR